MHFAERRRRPRHESELRAVATQRERARHESLRLGDARDLWPRSVYAEQMTRRFLERRKVNAIIVPFHETRFLVEVLRETHDRHLKTVRFMQARALTALKQFPLTNGMEAMRATELAIKLERLIVGEPSERTETVELVTKREMERWLVPAGEDEANDEPAPDAEAG